MKFMKKIAVKILLILLVPTGVYTNAYAQDDDSEPSELHLFRGGFLDVNFGLNLNNVGSSIGSGAMGGLITSRVKNGALNVNLNPALLGLMTEGQVSFSSRVGLGTSMTSGIKTSLRGTFNDEIESAINDEFSNEANWTQFPETYINPTKIRDFDLGFNDEISSISFAAPINDKYVIAGSYNYPASINLDFGVTGLSAKLAQEQGTEEVAIRFDVLMNVSLLTEMRFRMSTLSIGGGMKLYESFDRKITAGATITRYQVDNTRKLKADLSGLVVVGGADERFFNNENDPNLNPELGESNAFFMDAYGSFQSTGYGAKIGFNYQLDERVNFSIVYDHVPDFDLVGKDKIASAFLPVFLVGSGDDILKGDIEVTLDSLQANKPNLTTERDISSIVDDGTLRLPSSIKFGTDIVMGKHTMVLNYTNYLSELSFENGGQTIGKNLTYGIGLGFDFKMRDRFDSGWQLLSLPIRLLFLDFDGLLFQSLGRVTGYKDSHYRLGGNIVFGDGIVTVKNDGLRSTLGGTLPQSFSMGRQYTLFDKLDVGVTVLAIPDLFLKYSVAIRF